MSAEGWMWVMGDSQAAVAASQGSQPQKGRQHAISKPRVSFNRSESPGKRLAESANYRENGLFTARSEWIAIQSEANNAELQLTCREAEIVRTFSSLLLGEGEGSRILAPSR